MKVITRLMMMMMMVVVVMMMIIPGQFYWNLERPSVCKENSLGGYVSQA
jgi:hypothetical protein